MKKKKVPSLTHYHAQILNMWEWRDGVGINLSEHER